MKVPRSRRAFGGATKFRFATLLAASALCLLGVFAPASVAHSTSKKIQLTGTVTGQTTGECPSTDNKLTVATLRQGKKDSPDVSVGHVTVTLPGRGGHSPPSFSIAREISASGE